MGIIKSYVDYLKDNPKRLWFKRKLYGWGWTPARWQGWLVIIVAIGFLVLGVYIGDTDDAPGAVLFGFIIMVLIVFYFGYKKGEKPRWQWGLPKDDSVK